MHVTAHNARAYAPSARGDTPMSFGHIYLAITMDITELESTWTLILILSGLLIVLFSLGGGREGGAFIEQPSPSWQRLAPQLHCQRSRFSFIERIKTIDAAFLAVPIP